MAPPSLSDQARIVAANGLYRLILPTANVAEVQQSQQQQDQPSKGKKRKKGGSSTKVVQQQGDARRHVEAVGVVTLWDAIREYAMVPGEKRHHLAHHTARR